MESELRSNFTDSLEKLKTVHTQEELEQVKQEIEKAKAELMKSSEAFKQEMNQKKSLLQRDMSNKQKSVKGRNFGIEMPQRISPAMMNPRMRELNRDYVKMQRPKIAVGIKMVCPECGDSDMGNVKSFGRGKRKKKHSWCMKCDAQLVSLGKVDKWRGKIKLRKKFTSEERKMGYGR